MPRHAYKKPPFKQNLLYKSHEVTKLISYLMLDGKKSVAERIVAQVFEGLAQQKKDPKKILADALHNATPHFEVKPRRLGGASYLVPIEVRPGRKLFLGLKWIIDAAGTRPNKEYKTFASKLLAELLDAAQNQGNAVAKRASTEKLAEANKAFAHLKW